MSSQSQILIVDDLEANRELLRDQVEVLGHSSVLADNGLSALAQIKQEPPDLVLLDMIMPEMDGLQFLEILKSNTSLGDIPVIMVSALDEMESVVRCIELGAVDYLTKPIKPKLLKARVQSALARKSLNDLEKQYRAQLENYNLDLETKVREHTQELYETQLEVMYRLARAAEYRDNETGQHVVRMGLYCERLAQAAGWREKECELMRYASPMHDIGKIGIPDHILLKPGKLDPEEWKIMKTHPTIGGEILSGSQSDLLNMAETIAHTHHEKWDGSGYPKGLKGEQIPLAGRIVALCDVFDALTSDHPHKKAWPVEKAMEEIEKDKGKYFDPNLVTLFKTILPEILKIRERYSENSGKSGPLRNFLKEGNVSGNGESIFRKLFEKQESRKKTLV